jgi:hypothetical protein
MNGQKFAGKAVVGTANVKSLKRSFSVNMTVKTVT